MTKRLYAILRYTAVVAIVASVFVLSGCNDDDGPPVFNGTTLEFIKSDQFKQATTGSPDNAFDSIAMYLDKFPDLAAYLSGTTEYTFFAPSNKAFVSLTALPGLKDPDQINPEIIKGVLIYHIVAGKKMQSDLTAGTSISTMYTDPSSPATAQVIKVNTDGTLLTGSTTTNIQVTAFDQLTNNGVVHTTATVLIPPSTGGQLAAILGSLGATVLLGKDFTYMAYMIGVADAGVTDPTKTFTAVVAKGQKLTLLAIPNAVFVAMTGKASPTDAEVKTAITTAFTSGLAGTARATLNNHVLGKQYTVAAATGDNSTFATGTVASLGKVLGVTTGVPTATCKCPTGVVLATSSTAVAPIVKADISTAAGISNGILQVVGGILK
ncbi:MAG TPA: fasciclin domain-containing protein [Cyclobacteriaceae bacterium]|nr:fasciclin domain-containing protein [Cyclobacteriaceae bacterium]